MLPSENKDLSANLEDYLETIYHLQHENKVARAKDIADRLSVARASVTGALKALAEKGMINYEPYSFITLTSGGEVVAKKIVRRHETLKDFFHHFLMLGSEAAEANACRVEHAMDDEAMARLVSFLEFVRSCPRTNQDWLEAFNSFCRQQGQPPDCQNCLEKCKTSLDS